VGTIYIARFHPCNLVSPATYLPILVRVRSHTFIFKAPNYMLARTLTQRVVQMTTDMAGLRYSPDDPYYGPVPVHTSLYVRVA